MIRISILIWIDSIVVSPGNVSIIAINHAVISAQISSIRNRERNSVSIIIYIIIYIIYNIYN